MLSINTILKNEKTNVMAEPKTKPTAASVNDFIEKSAGAKKKLDAYALLEMMKSITKEEPVMWGPSIIGFGTYTQKYANGKEYKWPIAGFSPRKQNLVVYIMPGFEKYDDLMEKLGKYKTGKSCLYINKLEDIDVKVLKEIINSSYIFMKINFK